MEKFILEFGPTNFHSEMGCKCFVATRLLSALLQPLHSLAPGPRQVPGRGALKSLSTTKWKGHHNKYRWTWKLQGGCGHIALCPFLSASQFPGRLWLQSPVAFPMQAQQHVLTGASSAGSSGIPVCWCRLTSAVSPFFCLQLSWPVKHRSAAILLKSLLGLIFHRLGQDPVTCDHVIQADWCRFEMPHYPLDASVDIPGWLFGWGVE